MLIYPALGIVAGHGLMAGPMFGVAPCPTTIFTIGMLMLARGRWVKWLSIIPLLWSIVGLAAALQLGIPEDFGLPVAGLFLLIVLVRSCSGRGRIMRDQLIPPEISAETETAGVFLDECTLSLGALPAFFVLAFAWSWSIGFAATQLQAPHPRLSTMLMMLSGFGPSLAGIAVVVALSTRDEFCGWLTRCLNWHIGWRRFAFAFALPPAVMLLACVSACNFDPALPR